MTTLCGSQITKDDLERIFQHYFKTNVKLVKVQATVISKGLGFLSDVMRVDLTWNEDTDLPTRVVVKAPKIDNVHEIANEMGGAKFEGTFVTAAHNTECKAYKILQHGSPIAIPKVYDCWPMLEHSHPCVVMEDMTEKAGLRNIADGVSLDQWRNVVASLADLHAWSLTTTKPWREQLLTMEDLKDGLYKDFTAVASFGLGFVKEKYPLHFVNVNEVEVKKVLDYNSLLQNQAEFRSKMDDVMMHGDSWVNNIMFYKNCDGSLSNNVAAFLDWQVSVKGCGINDLARFETWCVNHEMRRSHSKQMLRFYYDRMVTKAGSKIKANFEEVESGYKETFVFYGMLLLGMMAGIMNSMVKAYEDETGSRKNEMLERAKALYEDAASLKGWF